MLISVSHDTVVSNKHEERTRHYYINFQQGPRQRTLTPWTWAPPGVVITTSWDEDKSTKKEKEDKGKGCDWSKSISRNVFGWGMSLVKRLWKPGRKVGKSLDSRHQSGCAESCNRYNILSVEEIEKSEDSTDNKNISNSTLLSEGSPSGLTRDVKPGLYSSTKNNKILKKKSQKTHLCTASDPHEKYAYLFRLRQLVVKMALLNSMCS